MSSITHKSSQASDDLLTVSVVIPCLNEEENITQCVQAALRALAEAQLRGEVIVVDNASEDRSAKLALAAGATVVSEPRRGYGSAYLAGFASATGIYIVMADADLTYDFADIPRFIDRLEQGFDLVMGDRMDNIKPDAMPWLHQYVGNPLLSGFLNLLFRTGVRDAHCGMRAFRRSALPKLELRTAGMEFASEMVIRAARANLPIDQIPIEYHPRGGESKLSTFRDGWRHLRFLLAHSPTYLFVLPGLIMLVLGLLLSGMVLAGTTVLGRHWEIHAMIGASLLEIVGVQVVGLGLCARAYASYFMSYADRWFDQARARFRLEHGLVLGLTVGAAGAAMCVVVIVRWINHGFGALGEERLALSGATLVIVGVQIFFTSFLLSILGLRRTDRS